MKFKELGVSIFIIADPEKRPSKILELLDLKGIAYQRIPPIFLENFPPGFNPKRSRVLSKKNLSLSEIGCAKSHLACYETFLNSDRDFAVIFEDDALIINSKLNIFYEITEKFLKLTKSISREKSVALLYYTESANLIRFNPEFYRIVGNASHAMAYLINRNAARELISRNSNTDFVADWPKGTSIKYFLPAMSLFEHGSKNGSVESFIEPERTSSKLTLGSKLLQNIRIISFENYYSNRKYFTGIGEYVKILWIPLLQWQFFRALYRSFPNSKNLKCVEKSI
jgi:GR25 family glycosyltransferase involved in LPS biosynthesis